MSSTVSSVIYHERMEINNVLKDDVIMEPIDCSHLLYIILVGQVNQVSIVADLNNNMLDQHVSINGPVFNTSNIASFSHVDKNNVINIQLLYNHNRPMELELWNRNFHPVSLHGSLEHLTSDVENIKKSIVHIAIYIKDKKIEIIKSNDIKDFKGIGKAA